MACGRVFQCVIYVTWMCIIQLEAYMDERFIFQAFEQMGETVVRVKLISNKQSRSDCSHEFPKGSISDFPYGHFFMQLSWHGWLVKYQDGIKYIEILSRISTFKPELSYAGVVQQSSNSAWCMLVVKCQFINFIIIILCSVVCLGTLTVAYLTNVNCHTFSWAWLVILDFGMDILNVIVDFFLNFEIFFSCDRLH